MTRKQINSFKIIEKILEENGICDKMLHLENIAFIKNLKNNGYKISSKSTYRTIKKLPRKKYSNFVNSIVIKNGKKYFEKSYKGDRYSPCGKGKKYINCQDIEYFRLMKKFSKLSFIPKLVDTVIVHKDGNIKDTKYIYEFIEGKPLGKYIKKISDDELKNLKKSIITIMKKIIRIGLVYNDRDLDKDIIITKSGKIFFTGIGTRKGYMFMYLNHENLADQILSGKSNMEYLLEKPSLINETILVILMQMIKKKEITF